VSNFLHILDPDYLFLHGDNFFSIAKHGLFYLIDAIFLLIGGVWVFMKKRSLFFFLLGFFILATFPQIFHNSLGVGNFTPHIALIFPIIIIFVSCGIASVIDFTRKSGKVYVGSLLIGGAYLLSFLYFLHVYFFQFPLQSGIYDFPSRILSRYLVLTTEENNKSVVIYSTEVPILLKKYLFYSNTYTKESIPRIYEGSKHNSYELGRVSFVPCDDKEARDPEKWITIYSNLCSEPPQVTRIGIPQLHDSGSTYYIYNDKLCNEFRLEKYVAHLDLNDLSVEKQSPQQFCQTFIIAVD
jgi:tryptophan-rich sensory protein